MIRAVIFDLGGTLLEYKLPGSDWTQFETVGAKAAFDYLAGQGCDMPPRDLFVPRLVQEVQSRWQQVTEKGGNLRLADVLGDACAEHGISCASIDREAIVHSYVNPLSAQTRPLPGAKEMLQSLHAQGLKIGLISNTMWPGRYHLADLERHDLAGYFHHTLFSADAGVWKPHPDIFNRSLAALEVLPGESVFVGDFLLHDIAGAQGAGMKGIHIATNELDTDAVLPNERINSLDELPVIIEQWRNDKR